MPKNRNRRGANRRRAEAEGMGMQTRPGAQKHKAMGKGMSAKGQQALKEAKQRAAGGDHAGAAKIYRKVGDHLAKEGNAPLSARAYLRAARSLHQAGNDGGRDKALGLAIEQVKSTGNKKAVMTHFRDLVRRIRSKGNNELADHIQGVIQQGLGRTKLGRQNAEGRPRTGGGRRSGRRRG